MDETKEFSKSATGFIKTALKREKEQLLGTDLALFVSSSLQHYFIKKIAGLDIKKTLVTPNCINPENIHTSQLVENKIKDKYQLEGATVIGFVGSIFPYHGVDILIDAFDKLFKNYPETKLLIVGDGQSLGMLKEHAKSLHSNEHIIFTGNVKYAEVFSYINTMDITVLANTNWYCSPIKLLEYGAMGKATIAPDTDAVKDIMINEVNGH